MSDPFSPEERKRWDDLARKLRDYQLSNVARSVHRQQAWFVFIGTVAFIGFPVITDPWYLGVFFGLLVASACGWATWLAQLSLRDIEARREVLRRLRQDWADRGGEPDS